LLRSFMRVNEVNPGLRADHLLTLTLSLPESVSRDAAQVVAFYQQLPERLAAVPGVEVASATSRLPISGGDANGQLSIEGRDLPNDNAPAASFRRVLPNYFSVMGIPLKQGREFDARDPDEADKVVIVNESLAHRFWPVGDAIGKRLKVGPPEGEPWLTIVGVVGDVHNIGLESGPLFATYEPHSQRPRATMNLVVRTTGDPAALAMLVRGALRELDKNLLVDSISTMPERLSGSLARRRVNLWLMSAFATVALLLAAVGIFGVLSYEGEQRRHEIGVRLALGASRGDVLRVLVGRGVRLALLGVGIGGAASLGLTRLLSSLLFDLRATDPLTFASVALLLWLVALLACYVPARRATRVDPLVALRHE
jgi:putative ABC transport system permease protein